MCVFARRRHSSLIFILSEASWCILPNVCEKSLETVGEGQTGCGKRFEEQCYLETW